jgi:hypothetical protein
MNESCVIWGTGKSAEKAYYKLKDSYDIVAFVDNNKSKWNKKFLSKEIVAPDQLPDINADQIIIASVYYTEIADQLLQMGFSNILYVDSKSKLLNEYRFTIPLNQKVKKTERRIRRMLFVQQDVCIRTYKISKILDKAGIEVDLAYLYSGPEQNFPNMYLPWKNIIPINNLNCFIDYVNREDYDLVHYSNEPDSLCNLLLHTNKKIVHDTHDLMSLRGDIDSNATIAEFIANKYSAANIYTTVGLKNYAFNYFGLMNKRNYVLQNLVCEDIRPKMQLEKLSKYDNEIHCVYEGGISSDPEFTRYYKNIFLRLAENHIHVHFYTKSVDIDEYKLIADTNKYIHYEGSRNIEELVTEMTKYDIGLVVFNVTARNWKHLQNASANKLYEYLLANLPIAVSNLPSLVDFVDQYHVGMYIEDWEKDINTTFKNISQIRIDEDILSKNKLTMESCAESLIDFYSKVAFD